MQSNKGFDYHINKEGETIQEFAQATSATTKIRVIKNEGFSTYDFSFTSGRTIIYLCEVKTRDCNHDTYEDTILELGKVNRMFEKVCEARDTKGVFETVKAGFLVKFNDGMYFIDMNTAKFKIDIKYCPKTTAEDNGYKSKTTAHYDLSTAIKVN